MIALFIILGLALLIPDAYIVFGVLKQSSWWIQCLVMVPTLAYYVVLLRIMLGYMNQNVLNWLLWLTLCVFLTTIIFAVISAVGKGVGLFWHGGSAVFNWIALALSAGWLAICLYGIVIGWKKVMVESVEISSSRIPESFDGYKIVLSHDPSHWRREVLPTTDIDLTLSGHTHAMQFKIGNWSPSKWAYPEWGGMYAEEAQRLYVSTGVGENIAFRFGAYPQIVVLTLRR